ncbi:nitroreductase family protein [Candidatus Galacturonibacter soehngenii]|uniref:Nitroreductase n=1 Tax=Candidatus Galacturonatibacter soehngenii TaxID=2307010 RepID=A0A7V7QHQ5_9FIRM|nr:nitroreductase family protein [Candidatus Galacturonibacter soehngenii]KAB1434506.1 nitroreductase [Candidatus Galacturonibacter soehngenii]
MTFINNLEKRRTYYNINRQLPVSESEVIELIQKVTEATPDAFNMKSARVVIALGEKQEQLWDAAYDAFGGEVEREKFDSFKKGYGTVLYFTDEAVVTGLQEQYALYASNFPVWANQSNGMLQSNVWTALREVEIGASLQHYNPVIDEAVTKLFDLPSSWKLVAQMPFGGIAAEPDEKEKEDISKRVVVKK